MKKVIISGVTGFFGGALARKLLAEGVQVIGVDIDTSKFDDFKGKPGFRPVIAPDVELKFGEYKDNQQIDYSKFDLDALFRDTGWQCRAELKDHIRDTADWVKKNLTW